MIPDRRYPPHRTHGTVQSEYPVELLVEGEIPNVVVTPTRVNGTYLELAKILEIKTLRNKMTLTQFRSSIKLDLTKNLK